MKLTFEMKAQGYRLKWSNGPRATREIYVDVFRGDKLVLEGAFPADKHNTLAGHALILLSQAIVAAKDAEARAAKKAESLAAVAAAEGNDEDVEG